MQMKWNLLAILFLTIKIAAGQEVTTKHLLEKLHISEEDLLPEEDKTAVRLKNLDEFLSVGPMFIPEVENNITDPEIRRVAGDLWKNALATLLMEKVHGDDRSEDVLSYLRQSSSLGHKNARKLLAFFQLFSGRLDKINNIKESFEALSRAGSADAQLGLGFLYAAGIGVAQDQAKAILYYNFAALGGNPMAQMAIAYRHLYGVGVDKECFQAVEHYYNAAAVVAKGQRLYMPPGDAKLRLTDELNADMPKQQVLPLEEEFEYYKLKAAQGDHQLATRIGLVYLGGSRGINQNYKMALQYFKTAAEAGEASALSYLGAMYLDGTPVTPQSLQTAFRYFYHAAEKGDLTAVCGLGHMYLFGEGVKVNKLLAGALFDVARNKGSSLASVYLGHMREEALLKGGSDSYIAKFYDEAARKGEILGVFNLARLHYLGIHNIPQSCKIATQLLKQVAERGEWSKKLMDAFINYKKGDYNSAAVIYRFLSELGFETAQANYAHMLEQGESFEIDAENRAFPFWKRAADQSSSYAMRKVGDYYYYGKGVEKNATQAFSQYKMAAAYHQSAQAYFNLGFMYEHGDGALRDIHLARRYYHQVLNLNPGAKFIVYFAELKMDLVQWFREVRLLKYLNKLFQHWDIVLCTFIPCFLVSLYIRIRDDQ